MRTRWIGLVIVVLAIAGTACSFSASVSEPTATTAPPAAAPAATVPAAAASTSGKPETPPEDDGAPPPVAPAGTPTQPLTLVNSSGQVVCYVYISPTTDSTWGADWLGSTETIANGASRTFNVPSGSYDLRADDCSHTALSTQMATSISGSVTWTLSAVAPAPGSPSTGGLDYGASPNYGSVSLAAGFTPDPYSTSITSGGSVAVSYLGAGCTGYATASPDFRINWSGSSSRLRIFFVASSGEDTTLIVNDAGGGWHCNDDSSGLNPMVELTNPSAGQLDVWVGSFASGDFVSGTLYVSELSIGPGDYASGSSGSSSSSSSGTLDYGASPNYGSVSLAAGFTPDPFTTSVTSGGSVAASYLGGGCTGYATASPDFRINWSGTSSRLRIFFVASGGNDTTLIVNTATASWACNDDYSGRDPLVDLNNPAAGQIDVWVGSYSSGAFVSGTLYVTELSYTPSSHP